MSVYRVLEFQHAAPPGWRLLRDVGVGEDFAKTWGQFVRDEFVGRQIGVHGDLLVVHGEVLEQHDDAVSGRV